MRKLNAITFLSFLCLLIFSCSKDYKTQEINFQNNEINISARIYKPQGDGSFPAVVLVPSAEPDTKDTYSGYAEYFASHGIVVISYDKRGSGMSTGNIWKADFKDLLDDALSCINYMKLLSYVDTNKMGFLGHSQGGMYIFMADSVSDDVSFLINVSGSPGTPIEQSNYNIHSKMLENGASKIYTDSLVSLMNDYIIYMRERNNFASIQTRYDIAIGDPQKIIADKINYFEQFKYLLPSNNMPPVEDLEMYPFMRSYDFEPGVFYPKLAIPALVIYGSEDHVIPAKNCFEKVKILIANNKNIEAKIYENANHGIKEESLSGMKYPENYFEDLTKWIISH